MNSAATALIDSDIVPYCDTRRERFASVVGEHLGLLTRHAHRLCFNPTTAEDLVQETLLRAWRAFDKIRDEGAIRGWLLTTLRREHARLYERYQPKLQELEPETLSGWDGNDTSTEAFQLRRAVDDLPSKYRDPLLLQVLGGHSCDEIGSRLGLSRGAVTTRLFRARQKLRHALLGPVNSP